MVPYGSENVAGLEGEDLVTIEEEFRLGAKCAISGLEDSLADPEPHGVGGGMLCECFMRAADQLTKHAAK